MWRLVVPARIHINSVDLSGSLGKYGFGLGFAVNDPSFEVSFTKASRFSTSGPDNERAKEFLLQISQNIGGSGGIDLKIEKHIPRHVGLGSGTQLALTCGLAWAIANNLEIEIERIAKFTHRSFFSGIGLAAFTQGGFVVDEGYEIENLIDKEPVGCLLRYPMDSGYKIVLVVPSTTIRPLPHLKEPSEMKRVSTTLIEQSRMIAHEVLIQMLPALTKGDFPLLCKSISKVNTLGYKQKEIDHYGTLVSDLIESFVSAGAECAGMSSGGPAVYALVRNDSVAGRVHEIALNFLNKNNGGKVWLTTFNNTGARWETET